MKATDKNCKEEILALLRSTEREGIEDMIQDLESWGFFTAPASAGHHLNVEGGLARHSLNTCQAALAVWDAMKALEPSLEHEVKRDSIIIASLLHDVCKCDIYKRSIKKRKNALGIWEDAEGYKITYKNFPMGHGEKSLTLVLLSGLPLSDDEMLAIRWRVNQNSYEDMRNYDSARKLYPLVTIIQTADGLAASIMERSGEEIDEL